MAIAKTDRREEVVKVMLAWLAIALALTPFAAPLAADAQPAGKVYQIGLLLPGNPTGPDAARLSFLKRLAELGWTPGQNFIFEPRYAEGQLDRLPQLAAELVQLKVSLILTAGTQATFAAKRATATIPIVMFAGDPVGSGLVASLARPGGNITGLTADAGPELAAKRLELLKEAAPKISRVGILWNPSNPAEAHFAKAAEASSRPLGLTLLPVGVRSPSDFDEAFRALARQRIDALAVVVGGEENVERRQLIVSFAATNRLPTVFGERASVEAGGLMSYGTDFTDLLRRSATYIDKILKGAKPADLPVEQPTKFALVINMRVAKVLGLTIPASLLLRADEIIE